MATETGGSRRAKKRRGPTPGLDELLAEVGEWWGSERSVWQRHLWDLRAWVAAHARPTRPLPRQHSGSQEERLLGK